ncbi:MAG: transporter substrate-binding domain-containing protein, partial [Trichloromonas sp.]|nr:transporter substrate-binding domain-containing protein [Trichloromonas sp.]
MFVAPDFAEAARTVRVGIFDNLPMAAWDRESRQARGIFPELLEEIAQREGWLLEYRPGTFSDCFAWLGEGTVDLVTGIGYSEERDWLYDFSRESVLSNWGQLLA